MPEIKIPSGLRGDSESPKQLEILKNCWLKKGDVNTLSPPPGVKNLSSVYGVVRGAGGFNNPSTGTKELYQVQNDKLFKVELSLSDAVTLTEIGDIGGSADCIISDSFTKLLILVKGETAPNASYGLAYAYDGVDLVQITDPDFLPSIDVSFLLSRFVFIPADGSPFFWSEVNDPTNIQPEKFADAETLPDKNIGCFEWRDNIIICGGKTIEKQLYNGRLATFQRVQGATLDLGYIGGKAQYGEDVLFVGREPNGDAGLYSYANRQKISGKYIDEVLNSYTINELSRVRAQSFSWEGTPMIVWTFINESVLFYGDFALISSGTTGNQKGTWRATFITEINGRLICGDANGPKIGRLSKIGTDYDEKIEAELITYVRSAPRSLFDLKWVFLSATTGQSNEEATISLTVSDDGIHYYDELEDFRSLGPAGVYDNEISWGSPVGRFDNHCSLRFRWVTPIRVPVDKIWAEF